MAEVLAVVASGAGLASLAIQLASEVQKLRKRHENLARLHGDIATVVEDLETVIIDLHDLEPATNDLLEQQIGPILVKRCRSGSASATERLANLSDIITARSSKRHTLKVIHRSPEWKTELRELQSMVTGLKQDLVRLHIIHQKIFMQKLLRAITSPSNATEISKTSMSPTLHLDDDKPCIILNFRRRRVAQPAAHDCDCDCACHTTRVMSGKFWCLQYSPFGGLLKTCDNTTCTARRYRVHMRVALSRLGVPWAVVFGLDLAAEPGKFGLQPALHLERIANFTAPGFEILWKLSEDILKWEDAESQFRVLYKSDPTFVNQVDPRGHGYLEKAVSHGAWGMAGMHIERQKQLLHFFVKELQATKGIDSSTFMYDCASFSCDNRHLDIINAVVALGCDFSSTPSPNFDSWPQPCVHDPGYTEFCRIIPEDPFYLEYLETILETNPDFGDSPPLHNLIIHGSQKDFELLVQKSQPLERNVNFLGQSALHLAVRYPSRLAALLAASHDVSVHDKNGITPLMYAAAMNKTEAVTALIEHGADLFARDKLENYDFIMYAAVRDHWSLVWRAIDVIESRDSSLLPRVFPSIFTTPGIWRYMAHDPTDLKTGWQSFWEKVASKFPNPNVWFDNGGTLMHFVDHPLIAVLFVRLGYNMFNHRNHLGEHSVFTIAKLLDASLFRLFIKKGADINQQNHEGKTVLHGLVDRLPNTRQPTTKKILDTLEVLLDNGADANVRDHCACDCSPGGCLPGSRISLKVIILFGTTVNNPFWAFVWLLLLEDRGLLAEAKDYALSVLRREYFEEAGLRHTCCQSNELDEMDGREEQFWDIPDQLRRDERRDELDEKMRDWGARDYQDVKLGIATHLQQCQPIAEAERPREVRKTKPDEIQATSTGTNDHGTLSFEINYEKDVMYSAVDLMFIRGLSDMKLDLLDGKQENETKQCFDEFIDTLRETGGDKFSSWKLRLDHLSKHFV